MIKKEAGLLVTDFSFKNVFVENIIAMFIL